MNDRKPPPGDSPYRGPSPGTPRDKRERERDRQSRPAPLSVPQKSPNALRQSPLRWFLVEPGCWDRR